MSIHPPRLENKVALITGASSGLGRAISFAYASHGTKLIVCTDLKPDASSFDEAAEGAIAGPTHEVINQTYGAGKAVFISLDVRKGEDFKQVIAETVKLAGRLDIIVNNAGVGGRRTDEPKPFHEEEDIAFDFVMDINVKGVYLGTKHAVAQMMKQDPDSNGRRGWVVNIASILGLVGVRGKIGLYSTAYSTSKGAVMNLTRHIAVNYAEFGIQCNALCPGFTKTALTITVNEKTDMDMAERQPLGGWGDPKDMAKAAVFLVSEDSTFVTGIGLAVDGGYTAQ